MRSIACIALHYGKEYLRWAVRGVAEVVDVVHVFYTPRPSYGHAADGLLCPDTEEELQVAAAAGLGAGRLRWHTIDETSEERHRGHFLGEARAHHADVLAIVDADEVWDPATFEATLRAVYDARSAFRWLTLFANFWRSFEWMVDDSFRPIRFVDMRPGVTGDAYLTPTLQPQPVYHFGYAQSAAIMRYKMACHGHKAEFRPGWLDEKFFGWAPGMRDTHPCVNDLWTPRRTDPETRAAVRRLLHDHPYLDVELIA